MVHSISGSHDLHSGTSRWQTCYRDSCTVPLGCVSWMRSLREPLATNCRTTITPTPLNEADTVGKICGCWGGEGGSILTVYASNASNLTVYASNPPVISLHMLVISLRMLVISLYMLVISLHIP